MVEPVTIIIIGAIVLSGNLFQYLLNSRCSRIQCSENCFIDRDVVTQDRMNDTFNKKINEKINEIKTEQL